jgi:chromate transporter
LSWLYAALGNTGLVQALLSGLKAAVLAIVLEAVIRIGKRALKNATMIGIAVLAFLAIFVVGVPFPLIILSAGLIGFVGYRAGFSPFCASMDSSHGSTTGTTTLADADSLLGEDIPDHARVSGSWALKVLLICLALWLGPIVAIVAAVGPNSVFTDIGVFFSKMAVVTFGGAYAVLSYVAQEAVQYYHWLEPDEMLDGLGMAETTPGPLIMVLQFVGFMAALRDPGTLDPLFAGALGGLLTTWVTFVPCFMFIFVGAPYIEALRNNAALSVALSAITAAVVGVVMNLAIWFALHSLFRSTAHVPGLALEYPIIASIDPWALGLSVAAIVLLFWLRQGAIITLTGCSLIGATIHFLKELSI